MKNGYKRDKVYDGNKFKKMTLIVPQCTALTSNR